jgi:uncharacterized protein
MRDHLKRFGRGVLNFAVFLACVIAIQVALGRHAGLAAQVVMPVVALAVYCAGVRWIEGRRPAELVDPKGALEFPLGIAMGIALFTFVMLLLLVAGDYHVDGWGTFRALWAGAWLSVLTAILEEILFRGFLYRLTAALTGTWGALLLTSALFGAAHAFNPSATLGSSVAIALEAGVLLGAAYAVTRRLWLPIGLHAGWNFAEGSVFGMAVSGFSAGKSLIVGQVRGSSILTGGTFGPEASILAVIACLALALALLWRAVRWRRLEPPPWRTRTSPAPADH